MDSRRETAGSMKKYEREKDGVYVARFGSLSEAVDLATSGNIATEKNRESYKAALHRNAERFTNNQDSESIKEQLHNPPAAQIEMLHTLDEITGHHAQQTTRKMFHNQEQGDEYSPEAWLHRDPAGWTECRRVKRPATRIIRIGVNTSCKAQTEQRQLYPRGAAALALCDRLESLNYRVEIVAFSCVNRFKPTEMESQYITEILLKRPEDPLETGIIALALADVGFYRVIIFALRSALAPFKHADLRGRATTLPEDTRSQFDIILDSDILTTEDARRAIKTQVDKLKEEVSK